VNLFWTQQVSNVPSVVNGLGDAVTNEDRFVYCSRTYFYFNDMYFYFFLDSSAIFSRGTFGEEVFLHGLQVFELCCHKLL
jgi:hypothetical protein